MRLSRELLVANASGLHARPAARFAAEAKRFEADLSLEHGGRTANCKSVISVLRLGVSAGSTITVHADGPDAEPALERLAALLDELPEDDRS